MKELIGRKVKIFIRGLSDKPIIYTADVLSIDGEFITFRDRDGVPISVNTKDIIQIKAEPCIDDEGNGGDKDGY